MRGWTPKEGQREASTDPEQPANKRKLERREVVCWQYRGTFYHLERERSLIDENAAHDEDPRVIPPGSVESVTKKPTVYIRNRMEICTQKNRLRLSSEIRRVPRSQVPEGALEPEFMRNMPDRFCQTWKQWNKRGPSAEHPFASPRLGDVVAIFLRGVLVGAVESIESNCSTTTINVPIVREWRCEPIPQCTTEAARPALERGAPTQRGRVKARVGSGDAWETWTVTLRAPPP